MIPYLLIGAGFSRNWGGWLASEAFEYLLGHRAMLGNTSLRDLLWKHQARTGFEGALDEQRQLTQRDGSQQSLLEALESAIVSMFSAMNSGYGTQGFEFYSSVVDRHPVQSFLSRFKAIFTLNQDLLLERHYLADKDNPANFDSWKNWQLPGMQLTPTATDRPISPSAVGEWRPSGNQAIVGSEQPVFKLHGSSNWRTADAENMLILGGGKQEAIARYPLLRWYFEEFSRRLHEPDARLMVIGYSFRDDHINEVLQGAITKGLKLFVIDTNGSDVAKVLNPTAQAGRIYARTRLEESMQNALMGASRRLLREIFGSDGIERAKVMRFFER